MPSLITPSLSRSSVAFVLSEDFTHASIVFNSGPLSLGFSLTSILFGHLTTDRL
jgi:hypothetical protein